MSLESEKREGVREKCPDVFADDRKGRLAREKSLTRLVLTSRDYDVLKFLLEMKFAPGEELFNRFFKITQLGVEATSTEFMRRRLLALEKAGFLKRVRTFYEPTPHFVGTDRARKVLTDLNPNQYIPYALKSIDQNTFIHDLCVLRARKYFETEEGGVGDWLSDIWLRSQGMKLYGLTSAMTPDAVFQNSEGHYIAFELERTVKDRKRIRAKISKLANTIDFKKHAPFGFHKVIYWTTSDRGHHQIVRETNIHGSQFEVVRVNLTGGIVQILVPPRKASATW